MTNANVRFELRKSDIWIVSREIDRAALSKSETLVHEAADKHRPKIEVAVRFAFALGRRAVDRSALRSAIKGQSRAQAERALEPALKAVRKGIADSLPTALLNCLEDGGRAGLTLLRSRLRAAGASEFRTARPQRKGEPHTVKQPFLFEFDKTNQRAVEWIEEHALELAEDISDTSRRRIKNALIRAFEEGDIDQLYDDVLDAIGNETRAGVIAHHESMLASNHGQLESWEQAVENGLLEGNERIQFIATADDVVCPICEELDGETRAFDGMYRGGYDSPPIHVACRCVEEIAF